MSRSALPLRFSAGRRRLEGETLVVDDSGPWVVNLATTLPGLELSLTSLYLGHDRGEQTLVGELVDVGLAGQPPALERRRVSLGAGAFTYERRAFLYDHLGRVQNLAAERCRVELRIRGAERAAAELDPLAAG